MAGARSQMLILFVDDDRLMRTMFSAKLEGLGAQVEAAAHAEGALAFLENKRPDLIVCDAVMTTTDGFKLTPDLAWLPARVASAFSEVPDRPVLSP